MGSAEPITYIGNYTPVGDIIVAAVCILMIILVQTTYVSRTKSYILFNGMIALLLVAVFSDLLYHFLSVEGTSDSYFSVYFFKSLYHASLFGILFLFVWYVMEIQIVTGLEFKIVYFISFLILIAVIIVDAYNSMKQYNILIGLAKGKKGFSVFGLGYVLFIAIIMYLFIRHRHSVFKKVMIGFYGSIAVAFLLLFTQRLFNQSSFTSSTFLFPIIAMLYLLHSNPYDMESGAVGADALKSYVGYNYKRKKEMLIGSMYLPEFDGEGKKLPKEVTDIIRMVASDFLKYAVLFKINNGQVILAADIDSNPDYENKMNKLINIFLESYNIYHYDYKIVIGKSLEEISRKNEYIKFINHIHKDMQINSIHFMEFGDVLLYNKQEYILKELEDIYHRKDMNDSRIEVYCQPVLNVKSGKYDTAEALMRLNLPDIGLVPPDKFIYLAEEYGYIHTLSLIILSKTCHQIRKLLIDGYDVKRISVNISVLEMRDSDFCKDFNEIIKNTGIPDDKIAIEVTESQNENDFNTMKNIIDELKENGVKFYLDDFGTGYSNFERIMELPFDIIKFDRSLVIECARNEKAEKMVESMAKMFTNMEYSVLYEGIETDKDEKRCIKMSASYLQGYKYSQPIPIEQLTRFLDKKSK